MPIDSKTGPLTVDEIAQLWKESVDSTFSDPIVDAGEGGGYEAYTQFFAQLARVSRAIDLSTQELFIRAHSSQTGDPAGGARKATVTLSLSRSKLLQRPMVIEKGRFVVEEVQTDWSTEGGVEVLTGRRYVAAETFVFQPGEMGPYDVLFEAERPGNGYNNPLPKTITRIVQPGNTANNDHASPTIYLPSMTTAIPPFAYIRITAENQADTFVPDHVGQYVIGTGGAINGKIWRIVDYRGPNPPIDGGAIDVAIDATVRASTYSGDFVVGETVVVNDGSSDVIEGIVLGERLLYGNAVFPAPPPILAKQVTIRVTRGVANGAFVTVTGTTSGSTLTNNMMTQPIETAFGGSTSVWRILDWVVDWGLEATNVLSPTGGRQAMLDELGAERAIYRAPGEGDESYRARIFEARDVVTPNAIKRAANRVLAPIGASACLREVGQAKFPGFFLDQDALDYDFSIVPGDRFKLLVDFAEMRGFFLIGVPRLSTGDFGLCFDGSGTDRTNAFDCFGSEPTFYDGIPVSAAVLYGAVHRAIETVKAGGVGFDLYLEEIGCT